MLIQIVYTNSNCSDVWEMFVKENKRFTMLPLYVISDKEMDNYGQDGIFLYNNSDPYYYAWSEGVKAFNSDYFIYLQEDFILYNRVNELKLNEYVEFLQNHPEYSFIRLIKSGQLNNRQITNTLFEIESTNPNIFAMQATIWRSTDYIRLMYTVKSRGWLETDADYTSKMAAIGMKGLYHYDGEPQRGRNHFDSNVYPYVATALLKGAWNVTEYGALLTDALHKYKIDLNKRQMV